ncbi:ABC transporter substrate binding protein [Desulforhopalus sp. IMCC35007]|uniref:ABC transporter substrate binding protein n=1 Tax=Desulforhopalus sp. IMCC35007 TaxID=2569543 RepID=UPI0010AE210E|nr:ABC transporter substrate binding protein [Desulforhopalus sp. IMCC35007]TKB10416.1 PAS domain S-box protein [Desulforhopalus sp. IMCC35007]
MRKISIKWAACFIIIFILAPLAYPRDEPVKVLILNSYHKGFPWTDNIVKGVEAVFKPEETNFELSVEYMDTKAMGYSAEYQRKLHDLYLYKYSGQKFDLVISSDDDAFDFLREYHEELFPGTPVVFCGVNNRIAPNIIDHNTFTGILETTAHKETIDLILNNHPQTKKIFLIIDKSPSGEYQWEILEQSFTRYKGIDFIRLSDDLSIKEIEQILSGLTEDAAVIFFTLSQDKSGAYLTLKDSVIRVTRASKRPVYTTHSMDVLYGAVGGKVLGGFHHGENVAALAQRILGGEKVSSIPVVEVSPTQYVFNFEQLKKWGIELSKLPKESIFLNRPVSTYEDYKVLIWSVVVAITLLVSIIFFLQANIMRRKVAEDKLRDSEERFRLAFEKANDGICLVAISGEILKVNQRMCDIFGYSSQELESMTVNDIACAEDKEVSPTFMKKSMDGEIDHAIFEKMYTHKNGRMIHAQVSNTMVKDSAGKPLYFISHLQDITDKKKNDEAFRAGQAKLKAALDSMTDAVSISDEKGRLIEFNEAFATFHRFGSKAECYSVFSEYPEILDAFSPDGTLVPLDMWAVPRALRGEVVIDSKVILKRKDTGESWIGSYNFAPIRNKEGEIIGSVVVGRDITKETEIEQEIIHQQQLLKAIVDNIPVLITLYDPKTRVLLTNKAFEKTIGWTNEEFQHMDIMEACYPDPQHRAEAAEYMEKVSNEWQEFKVTTKSGGTIDSIWSNVRLEDDTRIGIGIDITEKKQLESNLNQAYKMESLGTLAGGIAHDFNNILSVILGFTELALAGAEKETPVENDLREVYAAGVRAKELVTQILTFARQSDETLKPIEAGLIVKETLKFIRSTIPTTIEIRHNIESTSRILGSPTQLHQIMMNLCTNAAHAMEEKGGTLEITLRDRSLHRATETVTGDLKPGEYIELKISDTGCGIAPHIVDRIFEPYFTTKGPGGGTGMGLALVHGIVEIFNGKIIVESTQRKGTDIIIYLPICKESILQSPDNTEELPTGQERILLVDDEAQVAYIGSRILHQLGYLVTVKTSSLEALELFQSDHADFDLVISDVTMPKMTGDQLASHFRDIRPDIPIILCSGYTKRFSEEEALKAGIKAFINKPIVKADLAVTVRRVLDEART